jgi:hypothetical protein
MANGRKEKYGGEACIGGSTVGDCLTACEEAGVRCVVGTGVDIYCPEDVQVCRDGTIYERQPPFCEFSAVCSAGGLGEVCGETMLGDMGGCQDGLECLCVGACADPMIADAPSICLSPDHTEIAVNVYEAEYQNITGDAEVKAKSDGYTGDGYVDYKASSGETVRFSVPLDYDDPCHLRFRYGNGGSQSRPLKIVVNGNVCEQSLPFPPTGSWTHWGFTEEIVCSCNGGTNIIKVKSIGSSGPNLDNLEVYSAPQSHLHNVMS